MYPHRIRLRGPWDCEPLARVDTEILLPLPSPLKMTLPCRWKDGGLAEFRGKVRFRRRFGQPRQIDGHERVWLTFAGVDGRVGALLNGRSLTIPEITSEPFEIDVTALLKERNELVVDIDSAYGEGGLWGEVALEIRCTAYVHDLQTWIAGEGKERRLHVTGKVVGTCANQLELYVIADRKTVAYAKVADSGQPFHLLSDELQFDTKLITVELVNGASVWHSIEKEVR
jgi:hypothetical protein